MVGGEAVIGDANGVSIYALNGYSQEQVVPIEESKFDINPESLTIETIDGSTLITFEVNPTNRRRSLLQIAQNSEFLSANGQADTVEYHETNRRGYSAQTIADETEEVVLQANQDEEVEDTSSGCTPSSIPEFSCMFEVGPDYTLHWTLDDAAGELSLGAEAAGNWVGFAFPENAGSMAPSDAVIGDSTGVQLYKLTSRSQGGVQVTQDNPHNVILDSMELRDFEGGKLMIFKIDLSGSGTSRRLLQDAIDFGANVDLLAAFGGQDTVEIHSYRTPFIVNFASGESETQEIKEEEEVSGGQLSKEEEKEEIEDVART
eukprot:TRINITY_DN52985_c0_g1_i7.p1 TRINITY_DN52985_c0_g1~~TRINITY_DN52985_c0_g1_i7.p1  ORF type:complete len:317 (-),score=74.08 TRINITY_DN52985_c0_g1_i7:206-1156(-)